MTKRKAEKKEEKKDEEDDDEDQVLEDNEGEGEQDVKKEISSSSSTAHTPTTPSQPAAATSSSSSSSSSKKKSKANEEISFDIGEKRKVTISEFKGKLYVNIREFYEDKTSGELKPGAKGIALTVDQYHQLQQYAKGIEEAISQFSA